MRLITAVRATEKKSNAQRPPQDFSHRSRYTSLRLCAHLIALTTLIVQSDSILMYINKNKVLGTGTYRQSCAALLINNENRCEQVRICIGRSLIG
jgi:hypothetical protein